LESRCDQQTSGLEKIDQVGQQFLPVDPLRLKRDPRMKIIISGPAAAFDSSDNQVTDAAQLKKLNGLVAGDLVCSDFLGPELDEIGLTGAAVKIAYDAAANRLRAVTEYSSPRKRKKSELKALADEAQGQWSDGVGEGGFDEYAEQTGISVTAFPVITEECTVSIEQVDDGVTTPPPKRTSRLFKAVESGDIDKIKKLLANGEDVNSRNKYDWTPLIYAIRCRQTEAALFLIEQGADVKLQARWGPRGEPPELETAIRWAAMQGDLPVLRQLIAAGADVDTTDGEGRTPAMFAANRGYIDLLQALIEAGCDLNLQDTQPGNEGHTALMYADPKRFDIMELLLKNGADPNIRSKAGLTASEEALFQAQGSTLAAWQKKAEFLRQHGAEGMRR
jgi:hypothetical protein